MTTDSRSAKRRKKPSNDALRESLKRGAAQPSKVGTGNALKQPQNRWQRAIRYTWDKNRGRG
jgi:hypothetical protein